MSHTVAKNLRSASLHRVALARITADRRAVLAVGIHRNGKNKTQVGAKISNIWPVGTRCPVCWSIRNTTILSVSWLTARRNEPEGSMPKCRGVLPWVDTCSTNARVPLAGSIEKIAMLLCPRFDPYRNLPEGWTWTSAPELLPVKSLGSVVMV